MISRGFAVLLAVWAVACSPLPPPSPPAAPPAPLPTPVLLPAEPCVPDGSYGRLPDEVDVYDEPDTDDLYAEENPYDPDDPKAAARHYFQVGVKAEAEGRLNDARRAFMESWSLQKSPYYAFALAKMSVHLDSYRDALHYIKFVRRSKRIKEEYQNQAIEWEKQAQAHVAQLRVLASQEGACILVDGLNVGTAALLVDAIVLDAGKHRIQVRYHGAVAMNEVSLQKGVTAEVILTAK